MFKDGKLDITDGTGSFAGYTGGVATFFNKSFSTSLTNTTSFVTFSKTGFANLTFDLVKFIQPRYVEVGSATDGFGQFTSRVRGAFNPGGKEISEVLSAFATIKNDKTMLGNYTNITLATTPIPTPALLPGLIGMGVAALRKRKSEVEAAETAKA